MAKYAISGVWKANNGTITHYAFHTVTDNNLSKATKKAKDDAITLLDTNGNSAQTVIWNYNSEAWNWGTEVNVVGNAPNRYLRTNHDSVLRDNLAHLINYGYIANNFI